MRVGVPFNPYKVFQGIFAPYWLLEHRGISKGAKLCYIRLLCFAGKDARCYSSLETLAKGLGVSDRQARDISRNCSAPVLSPSSNAASARPTSTYSCGQQN